jgi:hypothetical protein
MRGGFPRGARDALLMTPPRTPAETSRQQPAQSQPVDAPYTWGRRPETYLAQREVIRLMIFRSRLDDRAGLRHRLPAA